jgi:dTDP-4-dehydrorhamnose reductase
MKLAVLGANGQLGRDLCTRLSGDVIALTRSQADITSPQAVRKVLSDLRPEVVINCAAFNYVDRAETEPEAAFATNAHAVRNLAIICRDLDCTLLHCSTDYVFGFDQARTTPYLESDAPGPVSVYGASKLAGEYLLRSLCPKHYVVRTCGLYGVWGSGGKGGNFVETMLRVALAGKPLRVVTDQVCTPTYTADLASALIALLSTNRYGLYHITNTGACSWYDFARAIFEMARVPANLAAITSQEYQAPARRPSYSVLSTGAYESLGLSPVHSWREALASYLREREQKQNRP